MCWTTVDPHFPIFTSTDGEYSCQAIIIDSIFPNGSHTRVSGNFARVVSVIYQQPRNGFHLPSFMFCTTDLYSKESSFFIRFYEIDFMATSSKVQFVI